MAQFKRGQRLNTNRMHTILIFISLLIVFFVGSSFIISSTDKILFIGDSMTAYRGGWQHQFAKSVGMPYTNLSVSGKRTDWMLQTLKTHVETNGNRNYRFCIIWGGINDGFAYVNVNGVMDNFKSMIAVCKRNGITPIIITGYDPRKTIARIKNIPQKDVLRYRDRYLEIQRRIQTELTECIVVPSADPIESRDTDDGVHFIASGHRVFAQWVEQYLSKVVDQPTNEQSKEGEKN